MGGEGGNDYIYCECSAVLVQNANVMHIQIYVVVQVEKAKYSSELDLLPNLRAIGFFPPAGKKKNSRANIKSTKFFDPFGLCFIVLSFLRFSLTHGASHWSTSIVFLDGQTGKRKLKFDPNIATP